MYIQIDPEFIIAHQNDPYVNKKVCRLIKSIKYKHIKYKRQRRNRKK